MASFVERRPLLVLASGAATVSLAPILVKAASQWAVGPLAIALWRCVIGGALLIALTLFSRQSLRAHPRLALFLALSGIAFAIDLWVWHESIFLAGAGMATILGNTQVFFTALIATVLFGERLTLRFVGAASGALVGLVLLVGIGSEIDFSPDYLRGIAFGLATGVAYAVFLTLLRTAALEAGKAKEGQGRTLARTAWFSTFAGLALVWPASASPEQVFPTAWPAWVFLALLALVAQVVGWWTISASVGKVHASIGGLVLMLQPVLATIWSAILFGETLAPLQVVGAAITLIAIYVGSIRRASDKSAPA